MKDTDLVVMTRREIGNLLYSVVESCAGLIANQVAKKVKANSPPVMVSEFVSRKETASMMSVTVGMVDKLVRAGELTRYKVGSKTLFSREEINGYLQSRAK